MNLLTKLGILEANPPEVDDFDLADETCPKCGAVNGPVGVRGIQYHYACRLCGRYYHVPNPELDA